MKDDSGPPEQKTISESLLGELKSSDPDLIQLGRERFADQFWERVFQQCRRKLNEQDAITLAGDVCMEISKKIRSFSYEHEKATHFRHWLSTVVVHMIADFRREQSRKKEVTLSPSAIEVLGQPRNAEDLGSSISEEIMKELRLRALNEVLREASEEDRDIFNLRYSEKLKGEEIAERLGLTVDVVYKRRSRLAEKMRCRFRELELRGPQGEHDAGDQE